MTWTVQRQPRAKGNYYSAIHKLPGVKPRCVTVGYVPGDPPTATLTARLRAHDPSGAWLDALIIDVCHAADDDGVRGVLRTHRTMEHRFAGANDPRPTSEATMARVDANDRAHASLEAMAEKREKVAEKVVEPKHAKGAMKLRDYYEQTWKPLRSKQPGTWEREEGRWETLILPALGDVRLCDLDAERWTTALAGMAGGGTHRRLTQTAYRCAIRHAETLGWVESVHKFAPIAGSTKRVFADPEPLQMHEIEKFLQGARHAVHRALFALQIGQGLRPGEVILVRWEDIDFGRKTLFVRGTKNDLAKATVPLTPLSETEMRRWWEKCGWPTTGPAFTRARGGGAFPSYPRSAFRSAAERSGLNEGRTRKLFPYGSRHAFATCAAAAGIDRAYTKDMMRHSRASTVLDEAYIRVSKAQTAAAFAGFGAPLAK